MKMSVDAIVANPNFDVEQFVSDVELHETTPKVLDTLILNPLIMLSIAEGSNWKILERHPIDEKGFERFRTELGLEAWVKKTINSTGTNMWHGVIASDELALLFKRVQWNNSVTIWRGKNAALTARTRWKRLNMTKFGEAAKTQPLRSGERPIDFVRSKLQVKIKSLSLTSYRHNHARADFECNTGGPYNSRRRVKFEVKHRGKSALISLYRPDLDASGYDAKEWLSTKIPMFDINKAARQPDEVAQDIIGWLAANNKIFEERTAAYATG